MSWTMLLLALTVISVSLRLGRLEQRLGRIEYRLARAEGEIAALQDDDSDVALAALRLTSPGASRRPLPEGRGQEGGR
jgi:hypothetical protein